jgi:hypothetical protein
MLRHLPASLLGKSLQEPCFEQFFYQSLGQRLVDPKLQRTFGGSVLRELIPQLIQNSSTHWKIRTVILVGGKAGDSLAVHFKSRDSIGDALFCIRQNLQDRFPESFQGALLGLLNAAQILINVFWGHGPIMNDQACGDKIIS